MIRNSMNSQFDEIGIMPDKSSLKEEQDAGFGIPLRSSGRKQLKAY